MCSSDLKALFILLKNLALFVVLVRFVLLAPTLFLTLTSLVPNHHLISLIVLILSLLMLFIALNVLVVIFYTLAKLDAV